MLESNTKSIKSARLSIAVFSALLIATALSFAVNANTTVSADTSIEDTVTITVDSACTLSGVVPSGSEHTATITPGQNVPNIGITNMTAVCNDAAGYDIYAVGYSNDEWKNTNLISEQSGTTYTIPTGTAISGNNSNWSMKLATGTGDAATIVTTPVDYSNYANVPNDYTKVAYYPSSTAGTSGSSFTTTYQVFASTSQTAGTYAGKVKYTLVHPNNAPAPEVPIYMQDLTSAQCQAQATNAPLTVYDKRDGSDYTVRYINGTCWMTQNLRITHSTGQAEGTILGTDSDFSASSISFDGDLTAGDDSTQAYYHAPTQSDINASSSLGYTADDLGVWYNFCAASAKDIANHGCEDSVYYTGTESICPAGWKLPTTDQQSGIISYASAYHPIYGGYYTNGSLGNPTTNGYWWSSTSTMVYGTIYQRNLIYSSGSMITNGSSRKSGFYIRCVAM